MSCPSFEQLIDFLEGRLDPDLAIGLRRHLETGCVECASLEAWHKRVRSIAARDDRFNPPARAHSEALVLFEDEKVSSWETDLSAAVVATLGFDSLKNVALSGARSAETAERELVYRAGEFTIDVQITARATGAEVVGQILRERESGFGSVASVLVDLTRKDEAVWSTVTNEVGEFMMIGVDSGDYGLLAQTPKKSIKIASIPILF